MASKPKNVILIVADSLRYDSVYKEGTPGVPYLEKTATEFLNARSSGCWTLPATSCLFTGKLPHEHGATSQTRWLDERVPTLAEKLKPAGFKSIQVTANVVTTDIFNVSRGFDEVHKVWHFTESKHNWLLQTVLSLNRPRIRRMILKPKDMVFDTISEDLRQGIIWAQKTSHNALGKAKELIKENNDKGQGVFMFINLMETHYPYHIADTFTLLSKGLLGKLHEWKVLYHYLSQSFLKNDKETITQDDLNILRTKQQLAWKLIRDDVDNFCREMHDGQENLVVFCSDHGDNFGDQGWQYHFSNVTDGGNKVPLFWLTPGQTQSEKKTYPVSSRFIHHDVLRACGVDAGAGSLLEQSEINLPVLESFWYNNEGKTMDKYKYNQVAFIADDNRFVLRDGNWLQAPVGTGEAEPTFSSVETGFNPVNEAKLSGETRKYLESKIADFARFSDKVMNKGV